MADNETPAPGGTSGFSLSKRYGPLPAWAWGLIGGGVIYAGYRFYQSRQGSSSAATTSGTDQTTGVDFAPQIATLQAEIQQLQNGEGSEGGTTPTTGGTTPVVTGGGGGSGATTNVTMPNVTGQRANFAIGDLKSIGIPATTVPVRNPRNEYTVTGQTPRAGTKVKKGTPAVLRVKVSKRAKAA